MELHQLKEILSLFEQSSVSVLELEEQAGKLRLEKNPASQNPSPVLPDDRMQKTEPVQETAGTEGTQEEGILIRSPLVGICCLAPAEGAEPFVREGSHVEKGDVLCIVEAMKTMNEIRSSHSGTITRILCQDQELAEFDAPLFALEAEA